MVRLKISEKKHSILQKNVLTRIFVLILPIEILLKKLINFTMENY